MQKKKNTSWMWVVAIIIWLVINIRVEAGIGSAFERAVDGLAGAVLLLSIAYYVASRFFGYLQPAGDGEEG